MQTIITKFLAPTNTRDARIVAKCWLTSNTITFPAADLKDAHTLAAEALITKLKETTGNKWTIVASGELPDTTGFAFIIE